MSDYSSKFIREIFYDIDAERVESTTREKKYKEFLSVINNYIKCLHQRIESLEKKLETKAKKAKKNVRKKKSH